MSNQRFELPAESFQNIINSEKMLRFPSLGSSPEQETDISARLLYVTVSKYEKDWQNMSHSHSFCELFYVMEGHGIFATKLKNYPVNKNDLIIVNPLIEHTEYSEESNAMEYIVLGFDGVQFYQAGNGEAWIDCLCMLNVSSKIRQYIQMLLQEVQCSGYCNAQICQKLLHIILHIVLEHHTLKMSDKPVYSASTQCVMIKNYIDNHFQEALTLDGLAKIAHQNKYYLAHCFKNAFGTSIMRYLVKRRLEESKYLLNSTDYPIGEIGAIVGFSSTSVFCQTFKRETGFTPNEFRKRDTNR